MDRSDFLNALPALAAVPMAASAIRKDLIAT